MKDELTLSVFVLIYDHRSGQFVFRKPEEFGISGNIIAYDMSLKGFDYYKDVFRDDKNSILRADNLHHYAERLLEKAVKKLNGEA